LALLTHPKCGKTFPHNSRAGHCGGCCETFIGMGAFEKHRIGEHGTDRRCAELVEEENRFWQDKDGYWHFGPKLTEEEKKKLWPSKAEEEA